MARERLSMRDIHTIFRLHFEEKQSPRKIAASTGRGRTTIQEYIGRAIAAGFASWSQIEALSEAELEEKLGFRKPALFGSLAPLRKPECVMPDWENIHAELSRPGVTIMLLWTEYKQVHRESAYGYSQFCEHYNRWRGKLSVVMRQTHKAGEKAFVDYCDGLWLTDPKTGERQRTQLFVGVLGASSYTFAESTLSQTLPDWISSHVKMYKYFEGVSAVTVPDNLRSAVSQSHRYEPKINDTYQEMARHYGTCVIPARPRKPRDKAKVEAAVLVAQRWILARLRDRLFTGLAEMNEAIDECLEFLNNRKMRGVNKSRRELYLELDRPALKTLPEKSYEYAEWSTAGVNIDYHIEYDHHYYSVPYQLVRERVDVRATTGVIEVFYRGKRVASHQRSQRKHKATTNKAHMPKSHREHAEWTPSRMISWAAQVGPSAAAVVKKILESRLHPEQGFRSALGLIRLEKKYGKERVERGCAKAIEVQAFSYKFVSELLKNKMDRVYECDDSPMAPEVDPETNEVQLALLGAENIRGGEYYH